MTPRFRNAAVVVLVSMGLANASAQTRPVVRFEDFLQQTRAAHFEMYSGGPETAVRDAAAFEEMRQYILAMYQGVTVTHSFVLGTDHVDCVPIEQQPSVRLLGLKEIATPPAPFVVTKSHSIMRASHSNSEAVPDHNVNSLGSSAVCEEHTIPMMRMTLEQLTRFPDLRHFLRKSPDGHNPVTGAPQTVDPKFWLHRYAYVKQPVINLGGNSALNYWDFPEVNVDKSKGEVFSLSQQWYVGGTGTGLQTAEVGWQNYPQLYGDPLSHLFIYWTADNYAKTGCYNLACIAFVQIDNSWVLGSAFFEPGGLGPGDSTVGGAQYEFTAQFNLYNGDWWLYLGKSAGSELTAIGYYPGSLYGANGQLTHFAQTIEYGTESVACVAAGSVCSATETIFPPEGSGQMPNNGYSHAAYQRDIFYIDAYGRGVWGKGLKPVQLSPNCYQVTLPLWGKAPGWGTYIYVGGPGGKGC
jgi:hypothetical protein